jgi:hypothetical protein
MADYLTPEEQAARADAERVHAEVHRDAALNIAANEAVNRDIAEAQAADSRIAAGQAWQAADEMATDRRVLRNELASERAASSNSAFGFYLTLGVLLAAILIGGFYLYYRSQNPDNLIVNAAPAPAPPSSVVVTPAPSVAPSPPPVTVTTPPPVVNVTPPAQPAPHVDNHVNVTPPGPTPSDNPGTSAPSDTNSGSTSGTSGTSGTDTGTVSPGGGQP